MRNARAPVDVQEQPCHAAPFGRMRPKRARRATHVLPERETALANGHFFFRSRSHVCAELSPAQRDFSRRFVSVIDDIPRSYLPEERPGMIVLRLALTTLTLSPITAARAFATR